MVNLHNLPVQLSVDIPRSQPFGCCLLRWDITVPLYPVFGTLPILCTTELIVIHCLERKQGYTHTIKLI